MPDVSKTTQINGVKYESVNLDELKDILKIPNGMLEQHETLNTMRSAISRFLVEGPLNEGTESYVLKQVKITVCAILGNLMLGYAIGWSAPIAPKLKDVDQSPLAYSISDKEVSWVASAMIFGSIIGANAGGYVANRIGRKYCMLLFSFANLIGYIIITNTNSYAAILGGRTLAGMAGSIAVLNLVYIGEIGSPDIRGALLTMSGVCHVLGSLLAYSIGPYVSFTQVCYVCIAINCAHILAMLYVPESPVYYVIKGKEDKAKAILKELGRSEDIDTELKPMIKDINDKSTFETKEGHIITISRWKQLISEKKNRKAFIITTTLFCLQCGGGVMAIVLFGTTIFKNAQSSIDPNIGTIILGLTELFGVMLTPLLVERCGRRILLLISTGCCSLSMGVLGTYFYLEALQASLITSIRWLPLVSLVICLFAFNIGLGIIPNTLIGEMYSPRLRSTGSSISITLAWTMALVTGSSFGYIVAALHNHGVFWLYAVINAFGFVFTAIVVPETKGKSLMEIGYMLEK